MSDSPAVATPTREGPEADPALLANADGQEAGRAGIHLAVNTMQKFGRELEQFPIESKKLMEQVLSSVSSVNMATAASTRGSRSEASQDSFVRIVNTIADISPSKLPSKAIIETFVLSSVVLTAFSLSALLGGYLLAPFVTLIVPPVGAAIFSGLVAPLAVYYELNKGYTPLTGFRLLIFAAVAQGVLVGAALSHLQISGEPFVALSAIVSSFAIAISGQTSRTALISITVATSLLIHSTLGAIEGALAPVYFVLVGLYTLAALVPIQLSARDQRRANVNLYTAVLVGLTITAKCFVYGTLGATDAGRENSALSQENRGSAELVQ
uniref:Uncharacterized protein n=1 Tax=Caenorhabditis japonica TaxID=281687 RepID=A0A8R1E9A3_CAEJA